MVLHLLDAVLEDGVLAVKALDASEQALGIKAVFDTDHLIIRDISTDIPYFWVDFSYRYNESTRYDNISEHLTTLLRLEKGNEYDPSIGNINNNEKKEYYKYLT